MSDCDSGHCITCSDEARPMVVVGIGADGIALCSDGGSSSEVMTDLVDPVVAGETLLVHAGVALQRVVETAA